MDMASKNTDNNQSRIQKPLGLALRCLARQPRTERYVREYLQKKQYEESVVSQVITCLLEQDYLDDFAYAQWFIQSRIRNNPKSKRALSYELQQKGVHPDIFASLLEEIDEQAIALTAIQRKIDSWEKSYDREKCKKKVFSYLSYRGFHSGIIQEVWDEVGQGM